MKKQAIFLFLALYLAANASAELECTTTLPGQSCEDALSGSLLVLRMHDTSNTHAQLPDYRGLDPKYDWGVCCTADNSALDDTEGDGILDYTCTDQPDSTYTALDGETNTHAEFPIDAVDNTFDWSEGKSFYPNKLCMNATKAIRCEAQAAEINEPPPGFNSMAECVFGLSSENNAHVYECRETPQWPGFLKVYCTDEYSIEGDVLKLSLKTFDKPAGDTERKETYTFYKGKSIYLDITITNFTGEEITDVKIDYEVKGTEVKGSQIEPTILPNETKLINAELPINDDNIQPNSYIVEARITSYSGPEDDVPENNSDKAFITILVGGKGVTIPETSPLLVVLVAFGVLFILGRMPGKSLN